LAPSVGWLIGWLFGFSLQRIKATYHFRWRTEPSQLSLGGGPEDPCFIRDNDKGSPTVNARCALKYQKVAGLYFSMYQQLMMMITSGCYARTPWTNRLETPRDTYSISRMALSLILPVSCTLVWCKEVALCPGVVVLIIWPYILQFLGLGMVKDKVYALKPRDVIAMKARISVAIQITPQYVRAVASSTTNYADPNMPSCERR